MRGPTSVNCIATWRHGRRQEVNKMWQRRKEQTLLFTLQEGRGVLAMTLSRNGNTNPSWPLWRSHLSTQLPWDLGFQIWTLGDTFKPQHSSSTNKCLTTMDHMLRIQLWAAVPILGIKPGLQKWCLYLHSRNGFTGLLPVPAHLEGRRHRWVRSSPVWDAQRRVNDQWDRGGRIKTKLS